MGKKVHYGEDETFSEGESNFDAWTACHDPYKGAGEGFKASLDWERVECKRCLKKRKEKRE